ncbi:MULTISPECIES: FecCD family ABC transporter permease [Oceanobacillus]|uniref:Iron ABC transporter permease n=1 Tax=Oceanobacillus sojae TaxID=582851 RepID=A0A511ZHI5_9BACI|nr:iron ABC transporter permease [Oceanobacillus sojae]GEN86900.1 iron ABC transporter permease [Oceanobacillus sojae]
MIDSKLKRKQIIVCLVLTVLLFLAVTWSITSGEYKMDLSAYLKTLIGQGEFKDNLILMEFRMPRMLITLLAGMALSMSGAIIQSITKNPLAESGILGINAGGGFAIAVFIVIGQVNPNTFIYVLPLISAAGGILTALLIFLFSYNKGKGISPVNMVLIGVGLSAALSGGSITMMRKFNEDQAEFIAAWMAGNIWGDEWPFVLAFLPWILIIIPFLFFKSNSLNIINTNDQTAKSLGVNLDKERLILLIASVILSSVAVAVVGSIGFIGLMGPHIAKSFVGPRHQLFLPIALLTGAFLLVVADTVGQTVLPIGTIPAGIVVAIIGAPYFLYLMYKTNAV